MTPEHLLSYYKKLPGYKVFIKTIQDLATKNIQSEYKFWGDKLFLPILTYCEIAENVFGKAFFERIGAHIYPHIVWNFCKSVYKFEDDIFKSLIESAREKIPIEIFLHLKEWCIYIDLRKKGLTINGKNITYSLLCLSNPGGEDSEIKDAICLFISLGLEAEHNRNTYKFIVPLVSTDLNDCLNIMDIEYQKLRDAEIYPLIASDKERKPILSKILNLYLYILCENSTIINKNCKSINHKNIEKNKKVFSPTFVKTWLVKNANDKYKGEKHIEKTSSTVKPHVRRGHFHCYYTGPKDNPTDIVVKWIPPIYVNSGKIKGVTI